MGKAVNLKARGLYSQANPLSLPAGALLRADNVVIDRDNVVQPRRGFTSSLVVTSPLFPPEYIRLTHYRGYPVAAYSQVSGSLTYFDGSAWATISTIPRIIEDYERYRFAEAAKSLFTTTIAGVFRTDSLSVSTSNAAGLPRALDFNRTGPAATLVAGALDFLPDGSSVAYRSVIAVKNANGRLLRSAPSGRYVVSNTSGTSGWVAATARAVALRIPLPRPTAPGGTTTTTLTTSHFVQVYRSAAVTTGKPSDEMGQVYEAFLTSTDISNGYIDLVDVTGDEFRGASLYTNPSQEGILASNTPPPKAQDIALFKGSLFFANTEQPQSLTLAILAVGGTGGIQNGDTLNMAGETYTATTGAVGAFQYGLVTSGTTSQNIERTALNLVNSINLNSAELYAFYVSGESDIPGRVLIQRRLLTGATFQPFVGTGDVRTCWEPQLPETAASAGVISSADDFDNGLYWSKTDEPDSVPLLNYVLVGRGDSPIRRIVPLRDALIILKTDGIYRLTGDGPTNWRVDILDGTVRTIAPDSAVALGNQVYALTDQGVVSISESGVSIVSRAIEKSLLDDIAAAGLDRVRLSCFGAAYESDRKYLLFLPASNALGTQAYTYNYVTQAWTRWTSPGSGDASAIVAPLDDRLYLCSKTSSTTAAVYRERKARTSADYQDPAGGIATAFEFLEDADSPTTGKQFREVQLANAGSALPSTTFAFTVDSGSAQNVTFDPSLVPADTARVLVPLEAARGKKLRIGVSMTTNQNAWEAAGWTLLVRPYSGDRGGR